MGCTCVRDRWWHGISRSDGSNVNVSSVPVCNDFGSLKEGNMIAFNVGVQDWSIVCIGAQVIGVAIQLVSVG